MKRNIILASASPRRKEILSAHGVDFQVSVQDIEEWLPEDYDPVLGAMYLAFKKATAVASTFEEDKLIIGADTVVVKEVIMGKPKDRKDAVRMLKTLRNTQHQVITGIAVIDQKTGKKRVFYERTQVQFKNYSDQEMEDYIDTGEPWDKAGSYGIQGIGGQFAESIDGDLENVIGLPYERLRHELQSYFHIKI